MQRGAGVSLEWLSVAISVKKIKVGLGESKNIGAVLYFPGTVCMPWERQGSIVGVSG